MYEFNKKIICGGLTAFLVLSPVIASAAPQQQVVPNVLSSSVLSSKLGMLAAVSPVTEAVKAINKATFAEMGAAIASNAPTLGLDLSDYSDLDNKLPVHKALVGKHFSTRNADQVVRAFVTAVAAEMKVEEAPAVEAAAVAAINSADAGSMGAAITENASVLGLVLTDYNKLTDKSPVDQALVGQNFAGKAEVKTAFNAAVAEAKAVAALNATSLSRMSTAIKTYAETLGLDLTDYNKLTNKTPVQTALVGPDFANKAEVKTAFDTAVTIEMAAEDDSKTASAEQRAVNAINNASASRMGAAITANAEILGLNLTDYNGLMDKGPVNAALVKQRFVNKAAVKTAFDTAVVAEIVKEANGVVAAVAAINAATVGEMENAINTYATALGLDLTDYTKLTNKTPVYTALVGPVFANQAAVKAAFDAAVAAEKAVEATETAEAKAVKAINNASNWGMGAAISANAEILGLDLTDYNGLTDKSPVHATLARSKFETKAEVKTAFNTAVATEKALETNKAAAAIAAINAATAGEMENAIKTYATALGLDLTDYTKLTNKTPVYTALVGKGFTNQAEVKTAFEAAVAAEKAVEATETAEAKAVKAINNASASGMGAAITANAEILGLDLTDYNRLLDKSPVHADLARSRFTTKAEVKTTFDAAVAAEKALEATEAVIALAAINSATTADGMASAIIRHATTLGLDLSGYTKLTDKGPVNTALIAPTFTTIADVKTAFDLAVAAEKLAEARAASEKNAVDAINRASTPRMGAAIIDNAVVLGLNLTVYNGLTDKNPVYTALVKPYFANVAEVKTAFDLAVAAEKDAETNKEAIALAAINAATTADEMATAIKTHAATLALDLTDYNKLTNKTPVNTALIAPTFANIAEVKTAFDLAVAAEKLAEATAAAEAKAVDAINNASAPRMEAAITDNAVVLGLDLTDYNGLTNKSPVNAALVRKNFANKAAVLTAFNLAVAAEKALEATQTAETNALNAINSATVDEMGARIVANATVLGLDLTEYLNLTNQVPVYKALVGMGFTNKASVKTVFDLAVAAEKAKEADAKAKAITKIDGIAQGAPATGITKQDLIDAGATGLVDANLEAYREAISAAEDLALNTTEEIQGMVNAVNEAAIIAAPPKIDDVSSIPGAALDNVSVNKSLTFSLSNLTRTSGLGVSKDSKLALNVPGVGVIGDFLLKDAEINSFLNTPFPTNLNLSDMDFTAIFEAIQGLDPVTKRQVLDAVDFTKLFDLIKQTNPSIKDAVIQQIDFANLFAAVQTATPETKVRIFDNLTSVLDLALADPNADDFKDSLRLSLMNVGINHDLSLEQFQQLADYLDDTSHTTSLKDLFTSFGLTPEKKSDILRDVDYAKVFDGVFSLAQSTRSNIFNAINFTDLFNVVKSSTPEIKTIIYTDVLNVIGIIDNSSISRAEILNAFAFGTINKAGLFNFLNSLDGNMTDTEVTVTATLTDNYSHITTYTFHIQP